VEGGIKDTYNAKPVKWYPLNYRDTICIDNYMSKI